MDIVQQAPSYRKYTAAFAMSYREALAQRGALYGKVVFLVAVLLIFSALWDVVLGQGGLEGFQPGDMIWYLAITEWGLMAPHFVHQEVEHEIRSGNVACRLPRPMSYLWTVVADGLGKIVVRAAALGIFGFLAAYLLAGGLPTDPAGLVYVIPLGLLAAVVNMLAMVLIGLSSVWLIDASPVFWIWQKLSFVLGGLIFPLDIYPEWMVTISKCTPFYAYLYGVGRLAYQPEAGIALETLWLLLFWLVVLGALCAFVYRKTLKHLTISGG